MSLLSVSYTIAPISLPSKPQLKFSTKPLQHQHQQHTRPKLLVVPLKCSSQQQQTQEFQFERLFSNLNKATLKREPGICVICSISMHTDTLHSLKLFNFNVFECCSHFNIDVSRQFIKFNISCSWHNSMYTNVFFAMYVLKIEFFFGCDFVCGISKVGAGILAIPAVTQESGFLASAVACIFCWIFMVRIG